jgi:hypothetical protein
MSNGTDSLVLEHLRAIRATLDEHGKKLDGLDDRLSHVEMRIGSMETTRGQEFMIMGQVNLRLSGLEQEQRRTSERLAAIEHKLPNGKA